MRGSWLLVTWVIGAIGVATFGSYVGYTQARQRTEELNDITPLEEGITWNTVKLLAGWAEPKLPENDDVSEPPPINVVQNTPIPTATTDDIAPDATIDDNASPVPTVTIDPEESVQITPSAQVDPRRVTILLMGIDQRQGEQGPFRTDTMMVLSINPAAHTGVVLSLPRDLWVTYPRSTGIGKINSANVIGDNIQYPGGAGPQLAKETVSRLLGIRIDYYIMVNFDAFITLIDAIGDIEVCPPQEIDDPDYPDGSYGYIHVHFNAGCQLLGAEHLLEYARTRATEGGDIDRAARQQEVLFGVRSRVVSLGGVSSLIQNALSIWESVSANVRTDLTFDELVNLAKLSEMIPRENIQNASITYGEVEIGKSPDGDDILIPITSDIINLVYELGLIQ
jgi:LCP family protein required for cell wall assembly